MFFLYVDTVLIQPQKLSSRITEKLDSMVQGRNCCAVYVLLV
jgi:hypothetical protein